MSNNLPILGYKQFPDGYAYDPEDHPGDLHPRCPSRRAVFVRLMNATGWLNLDQLTQAVQYDTDSQISRETVGRRVRDLREEKYGGHIIERQGEGASAAVRIIPAGSPTHAEKLAEVDAPTAEEAAADELRRWWNKHKATVKAVHGGPIASLAGTILGTAKRRPSEVEGQQILGGTR